MCAHTATLPPMHAMQGAVTDWRIHSLTITEAGSAPLLFDGGTLRTDAQSATGTVRLASTKPISDSGSDQHTAHTDALHLEATLRPPAWRATDEHGRRLTGTPAAAMQALMNTLETVSIAEGDQIAACKQTTTDSGTAE